MIFVKHKYCTIFINAFVKLSLSIAKILTVCLNSQLASKLFYRMYSVDSEVLQALKILQKYNFKVISEVLVIVFRKLKPF